jgi:YebC/PmpR family DNA-binding regulatory protein
MAGHSKFKNIMHRKGAQDAKRAKAFTKIGREIQVAAQVGGVDPSANPRLRVALVAAREHNMTNDRIKRAIDAGAGVGDTSNYVEIRYEGYGPSGVAIIVEALTDNKNRTASEVRSAFTKYGGNLGETGSVGFMFDHVGQILYPITTLKFDDVFEAAVEAGADDVLVDEEHFEILSQPTNFMAVRNALEEKFGAPSSSAIIWQPNVMAELSETDAEIIMKLIESLEDSDDVQTVTSNAEIKG